MNESNLWYARPDHIPVLGHRGICAKYPEPPITPAKPGSTRWNS